MKPVTILVLSVTTLVLFGAHAVAETKGPVLNIGGIDQSGGTIKGTVKFDGKQNKQKRIKMGADPHCKMAHKDKPALVEKYIFGTNDTLQNVFVYVKKGLEGKSFDTPTKAAVIDQKGCVYIPHVSGVIANQPIEIRNSDGTLHNVKMISKKNGTFNEGMNQNAVLNKPLKKREMGVQFKCNVHPWMGAYVHVMEHPFFAVTQADGTFTIKGLPPGEYELGVWHEMKPFKPVEKTVKVSVAEGETKEVTFTYKPPKKKKKK